MPLGRVVLVPPTKEPRAALLRCGVPSFFDTCNAPQFRVAPFVSHTVVLVEGDSDRIAIETLASRVEIDLVADGIEVVAMGGATNVGSYVAHYANHARVLGLCDAGATAAFARAGIAAADYFVCVDDLEDELIRTLGTDAVLEVIARQGDGRAFATMRKQPAQRGRPIEAQARRFIGSHSGGKVRYAKALVDALERTLVPAPLSQLLQRLDSVRAQPAG